MYPSSCNLRKLEFCDWEVLWIRSSVQMDPIEERGGRTRQATGRRSI